MIVICKHREVALLTASYPSTEGVLRYFDPASQASGGKPWSKVKGDIGSIFQKSVHAIVYDARANSEDFRDVDRTGFAFCTYPSKVDGQAVLKNGPEVVSEYYPEIEQALRDKLVDGNDIKKIVIFDHTIRIKDPSAARQPVNQVHVDRTPKAAEVRVRRHSPEDVDELLKSCSSSVVTRPYNVCRRTSQAWPGPHCTLPLRISILRKMLDQDRVSK